ncbi:MAG: nucleotidyl transferase AbiEii/AbiGii toxin family protein [Propionibacteriaceae bacterium]|nr:nucleotidyl transferase AbiEii/AbiGii toxin family protein [Propionibacteriaceae bacterium]
MTTPYTSPTAVEAAIRSAAREATRHDPSLTVQERIRLEYFHRFLCRVFSPPGHVHWLLKGGTAMLARVPSARATTDIDLLNGSGSLQAALTELRTIAQEDLGDFFRFEYVGHAESLGAGQPYARGFRVNFDVLIGATKKDRLSIDLVVGSITTAPPDVMTPTNVLALPRLPQSSYRLYSVIDQVADKVCATISTYDGHPSSRAKDLVDLVVLALTQPMQSAPLRAALLRESSARGLQLPSAFAVPSGWAATYRKLASRVPICSGHLDLTAAEALVDRLLKPVLTNQSSNQHWLAQPAEWA